MSKTQVALAKKAAKLKAERCKSALSPRLSAANHAHIIETGLAADVAHRQHDREHVHGPRAPPSVRLLGKREVSAITGVTFQSLWSWMRAGTFPRSRIVGRKSMWLSTEIEAWLTAFFSSTCAVKSAIRALGGSIAPPAAASPAIAPCEPPPPASSPQPAPPWPRNAD